MRWRAAAVLAAAAIAAACQVPAVPKPGPPEGQPTETPTGEQTEQPGALPALAIADVSASEGDRLLRMPVSLDRAAGEPVSVAFATEDGTATAGTDYTAVSGSLTFPAGATTHTIMVPLLEDQEVEEDETFSVTLSDARGATLRAPTATATITDSTVLPMPDKPLELASLQVTGGGSPMYPEFDPGILHYARECHRSLMLQVTAQALHGSTRLTLLRNDPADNHVATGSLSTQIAPAQDQALVIELGLAGNTKRYVIHCIPESFPTITVLAKSAEVSEGLLFIAPNHTAGGERHNYRVILDNNAVPRYHWGGAGRAFRPADHPVTYLGKEVVYLDMRTLLDAKFRAIASIQVVPPATRNDLHDFLVTPDGTFMNLGTQSDTRDMSEYLDNEQNPYPTSMNIRDAVIQETNTDRVPVFYWNAWDHRDTLNYDRDCRVAQFPDDYATLNSIKIFEGDIVASLRGCAQVLRIDRSGGTGSVVWKLGGTDPGPDSEAEYLELVDDPAGEFCGQHDATLTTHRGRETVVLFDNGHHCLGPRKDLEPFSRVVEYDISSGTRAVMIHEHRLSRTQGYAATGGGVTVLDNGRWLISWGGRRPGVTVSLAETIAVSEVDPDDGTVFLHLHMSRNSAMVHSYRSYRVPEASVTVPLLLP